MDALLDSSRSNQVSSIEHLQRQLHHLVTTKSSETRAEHASHTFGLRHNTIFHLTTESENAAADGVDPAQSQQLPVTRTVNASETVQNQPADDPVLQKDVAKHIVSSLGAVESSTWTVRTVSRGAQGWTFTYICKDSLQAWNRANAKIPGRPVIGSYSGNGGLDPVNLSRPAFDCRGTLTIAFSKASRAVVVKYDHTPFHKTVTELDERLAPSLPPPPVNPANTGSQKTPKAKRPPPTEGEEGSRRKRKRKGKAPEALMDGGVADRQAVSQENPESQQTAHPGVHITSILNVPPAEAERRRLTAIDLLSGRGIDPSTLSAEQFNIFANQAPDLQTASLEMLAKFGAERLRIVHPDDRDPAGSSSSTPAQVQSTNVTPTTGPMSTPGTTETPTRKRRSREKNPDAATGEVSIGDGAVVPMEQTGELGTTESTLKPKARKTRGTCDTCKQRKVKCSKEHPSCSVCIDSGVDCVYLRPKPRRKSGKATEAPEPEDPDLPAEAEAPQAPQAPQVAEEVPTPTDAVAPAAATSVPPPPPPPPPDPDNEEFIPDPNILSGPVEHQSALTHPPDYYSNNTSGFPFPAASNTHLPSDTTSVSGLTFPRQTHDTPSQPSTGLTFPTTAHQPNPSSGVTFSQPPTTTTSPQQSQSSSARGSLPNGGQHKQTPVPPPTIPAQSSSRKSPTTAQANSASPAAAHQQAGKRPKSRRSGAEPSRPSYDGMQQAAAVSQAAAQAHNQPSPMTKSLYQSAARTKSRQGHKSQTSTPVANTSRPPPQSSQATSHQPTSTTSYNTPSSSVPNYEPYSRYGTTTNDQYASTSSDHGSSRIAYKPGSYQTSPTTTASTSYSSAPSYDYSRSTGSTNPLSQALNTTSTTYGTTSNPTTNQWPTSQTRAAQSQDNTAYSVPSASGPASASHGYGTRSTDSRAPNQNSSYSQPQTQTYGSYANQQPNANQQPQQNWYGFTAANSTTASNNQTSFSSNRNSAYGSSSNASYPKYGGQRPNMSGYSGHGYGGNDEQSIYDLLRAGGTNN